jgi:hypothetical protein
MGWSSPFLFLAVYMAIRKLNFDARMMFIAHRLVVSEPHPLVALRATVNDITASFPSINPTTGKRKTP